MSNQTPKLVRNLYMDSVKDYEDLLTEMQVPQEAQEDVFKLIKNFRNKPGYLDYIRRATEASHRRMSLYFLSGSSKKSLEAVELLEGPLKDISRGEDQEAIRDS